MSALAMAADHAPSASAQTPRPPEQFVTAWTLLLLDAGVSHGYELRRELAARGADVDPSVLYRSLRRLESEGWAVSRPAPSTAGPQRRSYRLTPAGRRLLHELAAPMAALRDMHDAFLHALGSSTTRLDLTVEHNPQEER